MIDFSGFSKEAFEAYTPDKWASNVHNLKRMRVKDVMLALCDGLQKNLEPELVGLSRGASDEIPNIMNNKKVDAQWVYWFRDQKAREALSSFLEKLVLNEATIFNLAPQDKHVALTVILRHEHIFAGLRLAKGATVDRRNFAAKLEKSWERDYFIELLQKLPENTVCGFEDALHPAHSLTSEQLVEWSEAFSHDERTFIIGQQIPAEDVVSLGKDLSNYFGQLLPAIVPFYHFIAWTRENDFIEANKQLQEEKISKRKNSSGFNPGDKVKVTGGLFLGKSGIVQEIDTKGQVKVTIGKLAVVLANNDLMAEKH